MSGKYSRKNKSKPQKKHTRTKQRLWLPIIVVAVLLCIAAVVLFSLRRGQAADIPDTTNNGTADSIAGTVQHTEAVPEETVPLVTVKEVSMSLGYGMEITDIGSYTGIYMEDGTDEIVSGVMMIVVTNTGVDDIQYAQIQLSAGEQTAYFTLTTLPAGGSMVVLESKRMEYVDETNYSVTVNNVALFTEPMSLCEDKLEFQILDGAINVKNISGEDITGEIKIYYKNSDADTFYGGITYLVRIEGGMKADEIKQIMASHFNEGGSTIMFATVG